VKPLYSYLIHLRRSGIATVLLVSDLEAAGGRDADLAYMRVAGDIAARIASGELSPGARLRAERDLAEYYEVSYGTVRRAMQVLRERALITTNHGRGTFVSGSAIQAE
jgi:DNA-binding GntR family transcriptional regulator